MREWGEELNVSNFSVWLEHWESYRQVNDKWSHSVSTYLSSFGGKSVSTFSFSVWIDTKEWEELNESISRAVGARSGKLEPMLTFKTSLSRQQSRIESSRCAQTTRTLHTPNLYGTSTPWDTRDGFSASSSSVSDSSHWEWRETEDGWDEWDERRDEQKKKLPEWKQQRSQWQTAVLSNFPVIRMRWHREMKSTRWI